MLTERTAMHGERSFMVGLFGVRMACFIKGLVRRIRGRASIPMGSVVEAPDVDLELSPVLASVKGSRASAPTASPLTLSAREAA